MPFHENDGVRSLPLFSGLSEQQVGTLIQGGKFRSYASGEMLFTQGGNVSNFFIVYEGAVRLFRTTPDGHETTAEVFIPGDAVGEAEVLQLASSHLFSAMAIHDSHLLEFPVAWFKDQIKHINLLALNLLGMLTMRLRAAKLEAEHKTTMSAPQQLACFLERLCILHDFDPRGFRLPYSKTLIASRLGMEIETLSRALAKLRAHGIVVRGTQVRFVDIEKIEEFVCANCSIVDTCIEHEQLRQKMLATKINLPKSA